ncbi:MAG: hypothetical protein AAF211_07190 [Myxococcota bacterium]
MMEPLRDLCLQIREQPREEPPWLVLADVLMEAGEPRGELIALTSPLAERERLRRDPPREWWRSVPEDVEARIAELTDLPAWTDALALPSTRGDRELTWFRGTVQRIGYADARVVHVRRGFDALGHHWSGLLCRELELHGMSPSRSSARSLVRHPGVVGLHTLVLHDCDSVLEAAARAELGLKRLEIESHTYRGARVEPLFTAPWLEGLSALCLRTTLNDRQVERLANCASLAGLRWLEVSEWTPGHRLRPLYESPWLSGCTIYPPRPSAGLAALQP